MGDLLRKNKGQGIVEYILLTAVIMLIFTAVLKSDQFKSFFGDEADFFKKLANKVQFEYRHGVPMRKTIPLTIVILTRMKLIRLIVQPRFFVSENAYEK